ncbi:MAG TPA: type II TA system antitoxin MqsA family protein [Longimicrobium sp.]|nr:type II TA system antitoxin MqsA family protein [Longimicrobium sp.]
MGGKAAHHCSDHLETVERERDFPIHGTTVRVREELYRCSVCGEEEYSYAQAIEAERRAGQAYRELNGFLHPDQIVAMRRRWGVTQAQLENALGVGRKTVARWEAGRVLQTRAMDNLLRAIDRFPAVLAFLAERQGTALEPDPRWAAPPPEAAPGLALPQSLLARLEREARDEGVSVEVYVTSVLSQGVERRGTHRGVERLSQKLDDVLEHVSRWDPHVTRLEPAEPAWLRDHDELQRTRGSKAFAL